MYRSVASSKNVTSSPSRLASVSSPRVYFRRNADVISMTESDVITIGSLELSINRSTVSVPGSSAYCLTSADVSKNRVQIRSSRPSSTILLRGFSTSASGAVLRSRSSVSSSCVSIHSIIRRLDILPALKREDSRPQLGYCGLRSHLFLWGYSPRRFVEQAYRWLCQTAVTPILLRTRSYRLSHILRRITVAIGD